MCAAIPGLHAFHIGEGRLVSHVPRRGPQDFPARRFIFQNDVKILDLARRGGAEFNLAGRQAIEQEISMGRGAVWLSLTREQYAKLRG